VKRELLFGSVRLLAATRDSDVAIVMDHPKPTETYYTGLILWMVNLESGEVLQALRQSTGTRNNTYSWSIVTKGPPPTIAQRPLVLGQSPLLKPVAQILRKFNETQRAIRQYVGEANYRQWESAVARAKIRLESSKTIQVSFEPIEYDCGAIYLSHDGKQLILYGRRAALFRIDGHDLDYVGDVPMPPNKQSTLSFSPDGKLCGLFYAKQDRRKLLIYDFLDFSLPITQFQDSELTDVYALASANRVFLPGERGEMNVLDGEGKSLATIPKVAARELLPIDASRVLVRTANGYAICSMNP
jgi:hypothetical protein